MTHAYYKLFAHAVSEVTARDVWDYCPNDPGFPGYVREFTGMLKSRKLPQDADFNITETIALTLWGDAPKEKDLVRFRRFRVYTNSVGVALLAGPKGASLTTAANYFAIRLIEDAYAVQDAHLLQLLDPVLSDLYTRLKDDGWWRDEAPFLLLGQLILALLGYADPGKIPQPAAQLVKTGTVGNDDVSSAFLWSGTSFDQLHPEWKRLVELSFPEDSSIEDVALLRDVLL